MYNGSMRVAELRRKHPRLIYKSYSYKKEKADLVLEFELFLVPNIYFRPRVVVCGAGGLISKIDQQLLGNMVFHLGLMEIPSYWKAACPPIIEVQAGSLSAEQIDWWKWLMINGMGEFFFQNQIDFTGKEFLKIISSGNKEFNCVAGNSRKSEFLTLIGGGKDSVVTTEFLKSSGEKQNLLLVNPTLASNRVADLTQVGQKIVITRNIDENLLKLNQRGYLNGHTPFSAELAFLAILTAELWGGLKIAVSNERSADEENTAYLGKKINHQFSKSYVFEKAVREYAQKYISQEIVYFSLLRPLWEIQISKILANYPKYFKVFLSCNKGQKQDRWCGRCPKCLSTFILLYPFLGEKIELTWKKNLYKDKTLWPVLRALIDENEIKPFECVGTREEIIAGLFLSVKKITDSRQILPPMLRYINDNLLNKQRNLSERTAKLMSGWGKDDLLLENIANKLKEMVND